MPKKKKKSEAKSDFNDNQEKRLLLAERLQYQARMTHIRSGQRIPQMDLADGMLTINAHMEAMGKEMSLAELEEKAKLLSLNYEYFNAGDEEHKWHRYRIRTMQLMVDICIGELGGVETIVPQILEEKKRQEQANKKAEVEIVMQSFKQLFESVIVVED